MFSIMTKKLIQLYRTGTLLSLLAIALTLHTNSVLAKTNLVELTKPSEAPQCRNQGPLVVQPCGPDEYPIIFDEPQYDDSGLFVECLKKKAYCIPNGLTPEGGNVPGVDGVKMRGMVNYFIENGHKPPVAIYDLASKTTDDDPLSDATITCNNKTNICTCVSTANDNECVKKLDKLCTSAHPFGSSAGVGEGCN